MQREFNLGAAGVRKSAFRPHSFVYLYGLYVYQNERPLFLWTL